MTHGMLDNWGVGKMTCNHRTDDNLISTNESTFKQGDSCFYQLPIKSVTHLTMVFIVKKNNWEYS